jgi:hypothetical protein
VIHAEVDRIGILKEQEMPERAGAVVAVDAVCVAGRVYLAGLFAERAFDRAGPAGAVDAAEPQNHGGDGAAEDEALPFEEATAARAPRLRRRIFVHPLAILLAVDAGAGDEDEAPGSTLGGQNREKVARTVHVGGLIGLVGRASRRGCVDDSVEVSRQGAGRQVRREVCLYRMDLGREDRSVTAQAEDGVVLGGEEETQSGSNVAAARDQETHPREFTWC